MCSEQEVIEELSDYLAFPDDDLVALQGAEVKGLPESESSLLLTLVDGTKFVVTVTKIEEGQ